jgi:hypothetical protein
MKIIGFGTRAKCPKANGPAFVGVVGDLPMSLFDCYGRALFADRFVVRAGKRLSIEEGGERFGGLSVKCFAEASWLPNKQQPFCDPTALRRADALTHSQNITLSR